MSIATLAAVKADLGILDDADDTLIQAKIDAAQAHLESLLGYEIADEFDEPPADLVQAVSMLAAHWYENREATIVGVSAAELPMGVADIVRNRRNYTFGAVD